MHVSPNRYQAFLSYSRDDRESVLEIARQLKKDSFHVFFDEWELVPGEPWQPALESALAESDSCVVFIGPSGLGPWQTEEMRLAINQRVSNRDSDFRVIPALLPGAKRDRKSSLPEFLRATMWVEFESLTAEASYHRLKQGILGRTPGPGPGEAIIKGECPYRGLKKFNETEEDARLFFGRDADVDWLLQQLTDELDSDRPTRLLAVIGSSGSGKSSLVRAGLLPAIRVASRSGKRIPNSDTWTPVVLRPGSDPLTNLAVALRAEPVTKPEVSDTIEFADKLLAHDNRLHVTVEAALRNGPETSRLLLFIDQFEEVFSEGPGKADERRAFIANLIHAAQEPRGRTIVIFTLRADFYEMCVQDALLSGVIGEHQYLVNSLDGDELEQAIVRPAELCGLELQDGLLELLQRDMRDQPAGSLPLLQQTMLMLWERRQGRYLKVSAYNEIGGLNGALETHANQTYDDLSADEQAVCQQLFLRLTQPGPNNTDIRRRANLDELHQFDEGGTVIDKLTEARLITLETEEERSGPIVEVAHESLIRVWSKMQSWLASDREFRLVHSSVVQASREWKDGRGDLIRGQRLNRALELRESRPNWLSSLEEEFVSRSLLTTRVRKASISALALVLITVVGTATVIALNAARETKVRETSERIANGTLAATNAYEEVFQKQPGGPAALVRVHNARVKTYEQLAEDAAADAAAQWLYGRSLVDQGRAYFRSHRYSIAIEKLNSAERYISAQLASLERDHPLYVRFEKEQKRLTDTLQQARASEHDGSHASQLKQLRADFADLKTDFASRFRRFSLSEEELSQYRSGLKTYRAITKDSVNGERYQRGLARNLKSLGEALLYQGDAVKAEEHLREALDAFPKEDDFPFEIAVCQGLLGRALGELGDFQESKEVLARSIATLQRLIEDQESNRQLKLALAIVQGWSGDARCTSDDYSAGLTELTSAIDQLNELGRDPVDFAVLGQTHSSLGLAYLKRKQEQDASIQFAEAKKAWKAATDADDAPLFLFSFASFLTYCPNSTVRDEPEDLINLARKLVDISSHNPDHHQVLGAALYWGDRWDESIASLQEAVRTRGRGNDIDFLFLALSHFAAGDAERGRKFFEQATDWMSNHRPNNSLVLALRAQAEDALDYRSEQ